MINKIRAYKCKMTKGFLGRKTYEKIEITKQLEMPIYDTTQLDGVLDTTQISLLNRTQEPLKPFTRIIIELYEDDELVEKIYRVVDNDSVSNVARGNKPIYRHTVSLVEITKILERRAVDNLTFTNYLFEEMNEIQGNCPSKELITVQEVDPDEPFLSVGTLFNSVDITNDVKLFQKIFVEEQLTLPKFSIPGGYYKQIILGGGFNIIRISYEREKVEIYRNGELFYTINEKDVNSYYFNSIGNYTIKFCYIEKGTKNGQRVFISYDLQCLEKERRMIVNNIGEAIQRLLSCQKTLIKNIDKQEFILEKTIIERLNQIEAPEFAITQGTLFEALEQIGKYFNAIPRLIPQVDGEDDYSNWNVVTFDFLDDLKEIPNNKYSLIDLENPSEEYATNFVSNVQNATISNYGGKSSVIEPCKNGYLSTRSESAVFEVSDNEAIFKTRHRIKAVVKAELLVQGETIDITKRIIEKSLYELQKSHLDQDYNTKSYYLYYKSGEKNIYGLNETASVRKNIDKLTNYEALKNIIKIYCNKKPNLFDVSINIEYIPFVDFKIKQYKTHIDNTAEQSTSYYNQQANEVDIEAYGENMHLAIEQTGNLKMSKTQYFKHFNNIPKCGQYIKDGNDKYVVFQSNREIITHCPMKCTTAFSKNFTQLLPEIAIKKAIRQFEISERESKERNIDIQNFCVIDTEKPTEESEKLNVGFGYYKNLEALEKHFNNTLNKRLTSATICKVAFDSGGQKNIMLPTSFNAVGRSIVCYFAFDDNYSAGTYIDTTTTSKNEEGRPSGDFGIENYVPYCDTYGKFKYLDYMFIDEYNASGETKQTASYYLYNLDETGNYFNDSMYNSSVRFGFESDHNKSLIVDKDNRECISVTTQLNFITPKNEISIHSAMVDTLPYITENGTIYKWVIFESEQEPNGDYAKGKFYELGNVTATRTQATASIKLNLNKNATANGKAYGILTSDNRLCVVVNKEIKQGDILEPLYLEFRPIV